MADSKHEQIDHHFENQEELTEKEQQLQAAISQMGNNQALGGVDPRLIEVLTNPDISVEDDPDDDLADEVSAMLSRVHMLANIDEEEYHRRQVNNRGKAARLKAEHPSDRGPGSKCSGEYREILTGEEDARPRLTPEMSRKYDEAVEVRGSMESLGIGGKFLDAVTKIQSAVETDSANDESSGSALSRARSIFSRGGS